MSEDYMDGAPEDDSLDGCGLDFTDPAHLTEDGEQADALVMFADCWEGPAAIEQRRADLLEWDAATREAG